MTFEDRILKCVDCGADFTFTADEQKFFAEKGFRNEPKRCMTCRQTRRYNRRSGVGTSQDRTKVEIVCATCGKTDYVPFKPVQGKPVYCKDCFSKNKGI